MSTEWITDRLPTKEDALSDGSVWMMAYDGRVIRWSYDGVELGRPWQPIHKPAPYVKPKRWSVRRCPNLERWLVLDGNRVHTSVFIPRRNAIQAQRIADLFNAVMP